MSVKSTALRQYQRIVDRTATAGTQQLKVPSEGWIATARKALGMSAAQLARRLGVTRARISQAERAEISGGATLKSMQAMAEALGCKFVYAIVPAGGKIEDLVTAQARRKARALVERASIQMALERQSLPDERNIAEAERIAGEFARTMPSDLWD